MTQLPDNLVAEIIDGDAWRVASTHGGDDLVRAEPFAAIELELARWWIPIP